MTKTEYETTVERQYCIADGRGILSILILISTQCSTTIAVVRLANLIYYRIKSTMIGKRWCERKAPIFSVALWYFSRNMMPSKVKFDLMTKLLDSVQSAKGQ